MHRPRGLSWPPGRIVQTTCGAGCASDTTQPQVDAVTSASLSHIIGPDGMPQSAHEPMRPNLLAYRHLHLSFGGTLDGSPAEKLRTYLYYL